MILKTLNGSPVKLDRNILERIFLLSKGSIEVTKKKIDKLLTTRGMMPDLCLYRSLEEFDKLSNIVNFVALPKLRPTDLSRVMVTQFLPDKLDDFTILTYIRYCVLIGEYRLHYDYCLSDTYILDFKNIHIGFVSKLNPIIIKKAEFFCTVLKRWFDRRLLSMDGSDHLSSGGLHARWLLQSYKNIEGYGTKIKGIHILNAPPFVDKLVFLLKQALGKKVGSRLHVHPSYEDLHKHVPKEILPIDYDGDEASCSKLAAQWKDILKTKEALKIIQDSDKLVTDESKRTSAKFNGEYLGMPGSFRKLDID